MCLIIIKLKPTIPHVVRESDVPAVQLVLEIHLRKAGDTVGAVICKTAESTTLLTV